jgi:hypothetical protein
MLQMGSWESQQPVRRYRLCERLEHSLGTIQTSRVVNKLPICALIQGF